LTAASTATRGAALASDCSTKGVDMASSIHHVVVEAQSEGFPEERAYLATLDELRARGWTALDGPQLGISNVVGSGGEDFGTFAPWRTAGDTGFNLSWVSVKEFPSDTLPSILDI